MLRRCVIYVRSSLVLGFAGSRALSSSHLADRALCEWISESFVPARLALLAGSAEESSVFMRWTSPCRLLGPGSVELEPQIS